MTMRTELDPASLGNTDQRMSWRAWLLAPLVLISLAGVVLPFMEPPEPAWVRQRPVTRERAIYSGELQQVLRRRDLDPVLRAEIEGLHTKLLDLMETRGRISRIDRQRVERLLREHR